MSAERGSDTRGCGYHNSGSDGCGLFLPLCPCSIPLVRSSCGRLETLTKSLSNSASTAVVSPMTSSSL